MRGGGGKGTLNVLKMPGEEHSVSELSSETICCSGAVSSSSILVMCCQRSESLLHDQSPGTGLIGKCYDEGNFHRDRGRLLFSARLPTDHWDL